MPVAERSLAITPQQKRQRNNVLRSESSASSKDIVTSILRNEVTRDDEYHNIGETLVDRNSENN